MRYIATIYTDTGHDYIGPDGDLKAIIAEAKSVAENWRAEYSSPVERIYVSPVNDETCLPDSDADPLWGWNRDEVVNEKPKVVKLKRRTKASRRSSNPTYIRGIVK